MCSENVTAVIRFPPRASFDSITLKYSYNKIIYLIFIIGMNCFRDIISVCTRIYIFGKCVVERIVVAKWSKVKKKLKKSFDIRKP